MSILFGNFAIITGGNHFRLELFHDGDNDLCKCCAKEFRSLCQCFHSLANSTQVKTTGLGSMIRSFLQGFSSIINSVDTFFTFFDLNIPGIVVNQRRCRISEHEF
mmetsp:Transcript_86361/g.249173  ORF Transcript_86361/g.249173 Transcript_86361/m.249173 type:complete len:105 (+) Transcript_86361:607-921(+)